MKLTHTIGKHFLITAVLLCCAAASRAQLKCDNPAGQIRKNMEIIAERAEPDTAKYIGLAYETIELAEKNLKAEIIPTAYSNLISYLLSNVNAERGYTELEKLRSFVEKTGVGSEELYNSWQNVVVFFFNESNPLRAMTEYQEMRKMAEEHNDDYGMACAHISIGTISEYAYEAGIENFYLALEYLEKSGHKEKEYYIYYRMADLSFSNDRYDETLRYLNRMMEVEVKPEQLELYCNSLKLMSYIELDNRDEAQKVYIRVKQQWDNNEIIPFFSSNYAFATSIYLCKYDDPDKAQEYIDLIAAPGEKMQAQIFYHKMKGDYHSAFDLLERYDTLQRQSMIEVQKAKVVNANAFYKNKELAARNLVLEMINAKIRFGVLAAVMFFVVVAAIAIFITIRRHNKHLKAERDKTEEQRKIAEKERNKAMMLSEMKTTFIQNMSHEVRTPLNSIIGFNDLLYNPNIVFSPEERKEMEQAVKTQSNALMQLLDNVIFLSRIDGHDIVPKMGQMPMSNIVKEAYGRVEDKVKKGVDVTFRGCDDDSITANSDHNLLTTAVACVLDNAAKFTPFGRITVEMTRSDDVPTANHIRLSVTNTGTPITPASAGLVFDRFEKLGRYDAGFGLGLSIARESLTLIGGTIDIDTECKEGTRFVIEIRLPCLARKKPNMPMKSCYMH